MITIVVGDDNIISENILVISRGLSVYKPRATKKGRFCYTNNDNILKLKLKVPVTQPYATHQGL
jgi:hypothetical protein